MSNYKRHEGDDLLSLDPRLKYKWRWSRIAAQIPEEELKKWTHFQCSICHIGKWTLESTQWGADEISYEATISYKDNQLAREKGFNSRIEAQIGAEKLAKKVLEKMSKEL